MSEVKQIIDCLGRGFNDGAVKGSHLGQILQYLEMNKTEKMRSTLSKLALVCGMNIRYVRENYLNGLEEFGIIKIEMVNNDVVWSWVGLKAFDREIKSEVKNK